MGDGYAIEPTSSEIVSPVAGEVSLVQGHASRLQAGRWFRSAASSRD